MNRICSFFFCFLLVLSSCEETIRQDDYEQELFYDVILDAQRNGETVDSIIINEGDCYIRLSGGHLYCLSLDSLLVSTIDVRGGWIIYGVGCGGSIKEECSFEEIIHSCVCPHAADSILGLYEGYTDWTFCFGEHKSIKLTKTIFSYDPDSIMKGINHRGFCLDAPENTLESYRLSRLKGFKFVETDIRFTADGKAVLLHDSTIDRTSNGHGEIKDITFEEVRSYDFGSWKSSEYLGAQIPTLEEFLSLCVDIGLEPNLELKAGSKEQIANVVDMVERFGLSDKVTYISFSINLLKIVLNCYPQARVGYLRNTIDDKVISNALSLCTTENYVYIGSSTYCEEAVSLCRSALIPLSVWVIDSKALILALPDYVSSVSSNSLHAGRVIYETSH